MSIPHPTNPSPKGKKKGNGMKNLLTLTLVSLLLANLAFAVVDTANNSMGFYFDDNADIFEI